MRSSTALLAPLLLGLFLVHCSDPGDTSGAAGSAGAPGGTGGVGTGGTGTGGVGTGGTGTGGVGTGGTGTGGVGTGGTGTGGAGGGAALPASDPFDGNALDPSWQVLHPEAVDIAVSGGSLNLTLTQQALWYNAGQGVLVYKNVTGNFKVTARVHARRTSAPAEPPASAVELGGLMARSPSSPPEDYVFIVVGRDENDLSVEVKTTDDSQSAYEGPAWPSAEAELRLCRLGADFTLLKRPVSGGAWTLAKSYTRPDLPPELMVGPNIYSLNAPDLTVRLDEVTFAPASTPSDCETQD